MVLEKGLVGLTLEHQPRWYSCLVTTDPFQVTSLGVTSKELLITLALLTTVL